MQHLALLLLTSFSAHLCAMDAPVTKESESATADAPATKESERTTVDALATKGSERTTVDALATKENERTDVTKRDELFSLWEVVRNKLELQNLSPEDKQIISISKDAFFQLSQETLKTSLTKLMNCFYEQNHKGKTKKDAKWCETEELVQKIQAEVVRLMMLTIRRKLKKNEQKSEEYRQKEDARLAAAINVMRERAGVTVQQNRKLRTMSEQEKSQFDKAKQAYIQALFYPRENLRLQVTIAKIRLGQYDINTLDEDGLTPLMRASKFNLVEHIQILINELHAPVNFKNAQNLNALEIAMIERKNCLNFQNLVPRFFDQGLEIEPITFSDIAIQGFDIKTFAIDAHNNFTQNPDIFFSLYTKEMQSLIANIIFGEAKHNKSQKNN